MMSEKSKTEETSQEQSERLLNILLDIRNDIKLVEDLVALLEGTSAKRNDQYEDFCKSYTILLFQEYILDEDNRELMLVACGLLREFEFREKQLDRRMTKYRQYVQGHVDWLKSDWAASTYSTNYRNKLNGIVALLAQDLLDELHKNDNKIGLIEKVPTKLKLPEPRYSPTKTRKSLLRKVLLFVGDKFKTLHLNVKNSPKKMRKKVGFILLWLVMIRIFFSPKLILYIQECIFANLPYRTIEE